MKARTTRSTPKTRKIKRHQRDGVVTNSAPWRVRGVVDYLEKVAEAKKSAAEYATRVRAVYDALIEDGFDPAWVRQFLLFQVSLQHHRERISKRHYELVVTLLPKPPRRKRGRPKGAPGDKAHDKRHRLYLDWLYENAFKPSLTQKQFAKKRLGITDKDLNGEYSSDHHAKVYALLQELKPARMNRLGEGQRRALEFIYPRVITADLQLALRWREAKRHSPALTKKEFLVDLFGWRRVARKPRLHSIEVETIREFLERLDEGEKQLTASEGG
jgi:hypothetical protein